MTPNDPAKWKKAKAMADQVYATPSAYKSGYIVRKYKEMGGTFAGAKPKATGLTRWYDEKWVNQRGDVGYERRGDIYRPSRRITSKTPTTWSELTPAEIKKAQKIKSTRGRVAKFRGSGPNGP